METMLETARRYVAAGLSVIPIARGDKLPDHRGLEITTGQTVNWAANEPKAAWRVYCEHMPTDAELIAWFRESDAGIGIVGGQISGGLVRIDFEHKACLPAWHADLRRQDVALSLAAAALPVVETGKGYHVYLRMPDPPGYVVLSSAHSGNDLLVLAETQGEGCYCVAPPSVVPGSYKWSMDGGVYTKRYEWGSATSFEAIPTLDQGLANALLDAARFRELWEHPLFEEFNARALLGRQGVLLARGSDSWHEDWHINWEALGKLHAYFERYNTLLKAVETAPPPPPSYDIWDDGEGDDDE